MTLIIAFGPWQLDRKPKRISDLSDMELVNQVIP